MGLLDKINMNNYKSTMEKIDNLNKKNKNGYKTFAEYVYADEIMLKYFNNLKHLEKRINILRVDSYEQFENTIFNQLKKIYNTMLSEIIKIQDKNKKQKKLIDFEKDIKNGLGHHWDKQVNLILKDFNEKYKEIDRYVVDYSLKNHDIDYDYEDPLYNEIVDYVIQAGKVSASFLQRKYKLGYNRAARMIDLLEERGIISPQHGSKPREVLVVRDDVSNNLVNITPNIRKMSEEEMLEKKEQEEKSKLSVEELMCLYNIEVDYSKKSTCNKIGNLLLLNCDDEKKIELVNVLLKYNSPKDLKLILCNFEPLTFSCYDGIPHLLNPIVKDFNNFKKTLHNLKDEMEKRFNLLISKQLKSIEEYNNKFSSDELDFQIIIIDEIYNLLLDKETYDTLIEILMNCKTVGIKLIFFSKFNKKNLNLGPIEDLVEVYDRYNINKILGITQNKNSKDIIDEIDKNMDGFDFEKYSSKLLSDNGFEKIYVTKCSNDFGVDVVAYKDDVKYSIQCKKYSSTVGISAVQEVIASKVMNDSHVAVVLTNNYFTKSAKELAKKNNVLLWDRDKLEELIENLDEK